MKQNLYTLFMAVAVMTTINTNAQKSGILKKDYYGTVTGDFMEGLLISRTGEQEFNKKANVTLEQYRPVVERFVQNELGESSLSSAIANSTVVSFPADADIYTANTAGEWITRKAYPGERGYYHTGTKKLWLSFSCGNLVNVTVKPATTPTAPVIPTTSTVVSTPGTLPTNVNLTNLLTGVTTQPVSSDVSWNVGYNIYSMGRNDRQNDFIVDAALYTMIQNTKQCCGNTNAATTVVSAPAAPVFTSSVATTAMPMAQQTSPTIVVMDDGQQKTPFGQTFVGGILENFIGGTMANVAGEGLNRVIYNNNRRVNDYYRYDRNTGYNYTYNGGPFHAASPAAFSVNRVASATDLLPGGNTGTGFGNLLGN